ncbi:MAG: hypothetical protein E7006_03465 [Alphaproteobacteria bacterium]|nr:hypothetical protein [Alphaproteobacteria bacterium]
MQLTASTAEKLISELGMNDLPLVAFQPKSATISPDWFTQYKQICHQFMASLTDSVETLAMMNLPENDFMNLIMGRSIPENLSIRFRIPLAWGGELSVDNLFMCKTFPHSHNMDIFILSQSGSSTVWLPAPVQKIYLPAHTLGGGEGGNGTEDRLTETIASQIAANRDM